MPLPIHFSHLTNYVDIVPTYAPLEARMAD